MKALPIGEHDYFTARGLSATTPENLNDALRVVLDAMPTLLYGEPTEELTPEEQAALRQGGVNLDAALNRDPLAETAVQYAAILASSLTTKEAATRMGIPESQVRQMIARRTLYSLLINNRRYIPIFQFEQRGGLVNNITRVNAALSPDLHPVEVSDWYTQCNPDLFAGEDSEAIMSPLVWLRGGGDVKKLIQLAKRL